MSFQKKIDELKGKIIKELTPFVKSDYVLLDLPYHSNIGDILIWEGEESFLKNLPFKCLGRSSSDSFNFKKNLISTATIFLHGGGNFGDMYPKHQNFRLKIIEKYSENPIIIFPQTISYSDELQLKEDALLMGLHKKLVICARDQRSYDLLTKYFSNTILLLPDMAFCIDANKWHSLLKVLNNRELFLKRNDKELSNKYDYNFAGSTHNIIDTKDWPTKESNNLIHKILTKPIHPRSPFKVLSNFYAYTIYRPYLVNKGVNFLSKYDYVFTTRLHGAILSLLLHKKFTFFDNSYGKNKGFYDTWLKDVDGIKFKD
jgi:exopolysaccharide biosynthesis predicted pyruvyltransferase EpsI